MLLAAVEGRMADVSIFSPASPQAGWIVDLAILALAIIGIIFLVVEGILFYSVWRFRRAKNDAPGEPAQVYGSEPIEIAWTAAPTMIVFFLVLVTTRTLWQVEAAPVQPREGDQALFVTVIGHQWWWEYRYDSYDGRKLDFITANELHMPVGDGETQRPVHLTLQSGDVCHSFWVPRLGGKVDLIPGRSNLLAFETEQPGLYLGQCAEYCGAQHANMMLRVVAETPAEFEAWLANETAPAVEDPAVAEGKATFLANSCVNCHRVSGTAAQGDGAPDLTHLMSRETIAAGQVPNSRSNLRKWVHDPHTIKPGVLMPAFGLSTEEENQIVEYLRTLK
ncbi:cytochrome c oxidase polypeptide II [Lacipirellula parvula]|uniref:Cytochrome c oxidase subunit 2 n=2 Tax=Lacipirellula parvula TaxID=2650471 RepID=A0A5K7XIK2_9BACT|nr:cytochrome c oxidase polypeptide II [Lacipirellula parvula]